MAELGIAFFSGIVSKVGELLIGPIRQRICYVFKYNSNIEDMKKQIDKLTIARERVQHSVDEAKRRGEEIENDVEKWLIFVKEFIEKAGQFILDDEDRAKKQCFKGLCPNLTMQYLHSRKAAKTTKDGVDLFGKGKFDRVSYRTILQRTISLYDRGYEAFGSRISTFSDIMEALTNASFNMIGVYGMGGVGKTTLVKKVAWQVVKDKLFDVVMVEVTQIVDIKKIQGEIADQLGMGFQEESVGGRADRLRERLKKEKRALVILDDIWAKLDLQVIGIPFGNGEEGKAQQKQNQGGISTDDKRRCKVLLTSRNHDVLCNDMKTQKNILVGPLSDEEARILFGKIVGDSAEKSDFQPITAEVVGKCAGLPVAIVTIANALQNRQLHAWKDALRKLRRSNARHIKGMDENVYSAIKLSYKFLKCKEAKSLFLLCGHFKAGYNISTNDLLKYGMGLGLFQDVYTLEEGRDRVHTLVDNLKASCLLLDGANNTRVKMHDIIHDVAISIASTDKLMFNIQDVDGLKEMLEEKIPKESTAISLSYRDTCEFPQRLKFPKLKLLLLFMEDLSLQIPDVFFEGMKELKVLDMSGIHFMSLPSSLRYLTNLRTLCLDECQLGDLTMIGELKKLEVLSFLYSDIQQLPKEIGQLTRLRLLDLSNCSKLEVISPNVLSSLSQLEELYMGNSFVQWEVERPSNYGQSNASLAELKRLSHLTALDIHIRDEQVMPQDLFCEKLERYRIFIGEGWNWSGKYETSRTLKLKLNNKVYLRHGIDTLLKGAEDLYLDELTGVKNILYELDNEGFSRLKHLHVQNGPELLYIINSVEWVPCKAFAMLESLYLDNLISLEKLYHGQLTTDSFSNLKIINVEKCDTLMHFFSFSMTKSLSQLEEIKVIDCKNLKEIVYKESEDHIPLNERINEIEFTQLRLLTLQCLPELTRFGTGNLVKFPSLNEVRIKSCPNFKTFFSGSTNADIQLLFDEKVELPSLEVLRIHGSDNMTKIWHDQLTLNSFCKLHYLKVECCNKLLNIFPSNMLGRLQRLETLEVVNCARVEDIVAKEYVVEAVPKFVFPQLTSLKLWMLPRLKSFYPEIHYSEWPMLEKLVVYGCDSVEIFAWEFLSFQETHGRSQHGILQQPLFLVDKVTFPILEELRLEWNDNMKEIWHGKFSEYLSKIKFLRLICFPEKGATFPSCFLHTLPNLERLEVSDAFFKEIFICDENAEPVIQLRELNLSKLPELLHLWKENSQPSKVFQKLATLEVSKCGNIKNLVPSSVSFQNLMTLEVSTCEGLINLVTLSTAKSLVQLTRMKISECRMIKEIITHIGGAGNDRTVFSQLKYLGLHCLPSLTSFYSGDCTFEFPSLEQVTVSQCPKMIIFSQGVLKTPKLQRLQLTEAGDEVCWKGDINTTIQYLFRGMNV